MKDKSPVNPINQNTDQVGINPYSPDQFKKPEKIKNEERTISNKKENSQKCDKLLKSKITCDDIEHPEPLFSDNSEGNFENIKKNFYDNKKKENLLVIEYTKELKIKNEENLQQKLKKAKDSLQLKENIGKVVLNSTFMNDKNMKKTLSQKTNLLIKPEKVVKNFILGRSYDVNTSGQNNLNNNNNNNKINNDKNNITGNAKNNSVNPFNNHEKQKLIKHKSKILHKGGPIIKIPLNLTAENKHTMKKINEIPQRQNLIVNKKQNVNDIKLKHYYSYKNDINKIPLKKITKIVPINNNTFLDFEDGSNPQENSKKISYNYIYKIQNNPNRKIQQERGNNIALNNMVININYNTLIKNNPGEVIKKNMSFKNAHNNKIMAHTQMAHSTSKSNLTPVNNNQKNKIQRISIPLNAANINNNKSTTMIFYPGTYDKENYYKSDVETNNALKRNIISTSVNKVNDSCYDSEKENYMNNLNSEKCNKKTIEKGGKFNNISTTYVVFSKSKTNLLQPSSTLENHNLSKKNIAQNLSKLSILNNSMKSVLPTNQAFHQKIPINQTKKIKAFRSQNNLLFSKKNKNKTLSNQNTINNSHMNCTNNFSFFERNHLNSLNTNKTNFTKTKRSNKPVIYKYNYGNNIWLDESFFTYFNTSGYNY